MNRRALVIVAIGLALFLCAALVLILMRPRPAPPAATAAAPAPRAAVPAPSAEAPAPAPEAAPRRPEPRSAPPPAPAATPVEAPAEAGVLQIDTDVPGAQVFIDREYIGVAPITAPNISPGPHHLNVSAQGYDSVSESIDVSPGPRQILIKFREVRLDTRIDVVHKHRLGSCKGSLIATPLGLRYETTDKDDTFSSVLLDLETFQVDYLQKNLKIKLRKGKGYDFTDPAGNADRLFVFHRDVEKARERLRRGDPPASQ